MLVVRVICLSGPFVSEQNLHFPVTSMLWLEALPILLQTQQLPFIVKMIISVIKQNLSVNIWKR